MSRTFVFSDWHPPIMSLLWGFLNLIFPDPSGMLFLHLALIWSASIIFWVFNKSYKYSWALLVIPTLPWVINFQGVMWKDISLAYSLLLLASFSYFKRSKINAALVFSLVFYAVNIRHNSIVAVLPLVWLIAHSWFPSRNNLSLIFFTMLLTSAAFFLGGVVNYKVLDSEKTKPANYIIVDDLFFLSTKKGESLIPGISYSEIKACSDKDINGTTLVGRVFCLNQFESYKESSPLERDISSIWVEEIQDNVGDYLLFRSAAFIYLLKSPDAKPYYLWFSRIDQNDYGFTHNPNLATNLIEDYVKGFGSIFGFFFKPYWWLLVSGSLLFATIGIPNTTIVKVLLLSSCIYIFTYFPVTPMADIRYVYWSMLSSSLAIILVFTKSINLGYFKLLFFRALVVYLFSYLCYFFVHSFVVHSLHKV